MHPLIKNPSLKQTFSEVTFFYQHWSTPCILGKRTHHWVSSELFPILLKQNSLPWGITFVSWGQCWWRDWWYTDETSKWCYRSLHEIVKMVIQRVSFSSLRRNCCADIVWMRYPTCYLVLGKTTVKTTVCSILVIVTLLFICFETVLLLFFSL